MKRQFLTGMPRPGGFLVIEEDITVNLCKFVQFQSLEQVLAFGVIDSTPEREDGVIGIFRGVDVHENYEIEEIEGELCRWLTADVERLRRSLAYAARRAWKSHYRAIRLALREMQATGRQSFALVGGDLWIKGGVDPHVKVATGRWSLPIAKAALSSRI